MKLTNQQIRFFDTFGFLTFPGLFAEEIASITEASSGSGLSMAADTTTNLTITSGDPP